MRGTCLGGVTMLWFLKLFLALIAAEIFFRIIRGSEKNFPEMQWSPGGIYIDLVTKKLVTTPPKAHLVDDKIALNWTVRALIYFAALVFIFSVG